MDYKKIPPPDTEMTSFDPVTDYKPPPKPFDDHDDRKESRNRSKERRISISLIILTFLASVCVLFGTLFPELSRGEIDMRPWRNILSSSGKIQPFLIRDRITIVNLGLWRYCYDDQLYDLVELINPKFNNIGRKRRDAEEESHSIEKRNEQPREGDISVRCHPIPEPWKMPYHVKNKTEATKVCLIIGVVTCILSFLVSILVLITRIPLLKILQLLCCFLGAVTIATALGVAMTMQTEAEEYFNESIGRKVEDTFKDELDVDLPAMGISLVGIRLIEMENGVCGILLGGSCLLMIVTVVLAEVSRHQ